MSDEGDKKITRLEQMAREQRLVSGAMLAVILAFGAGWWLGQRSVDIQPAQPQSKTGLTVGDMSQVCSVLESYVEAPLTGCETAAHQTMTGHPAPIRLTLRAPVRSKRPPRVRTLRRNRPAPAG